MRAASGLFRLCRLGAQAPSHGGSVGSNPIGAAPPRHRKIAHSSRNKILRLLAGQPLAVAPTDMAAPACGDPNERADGPRCAHRPALFIIWSTIGLHSSV